MEEDGFQIVKQKGKNRKRQGKKLAIKNDIGKHECESIRPITQILKTLNTRRAELDEYATTVSSLLSSAILKLGQPDIKRDIATHLSDMNDEHSKHGKCDMQGKTNSVQHHPDTSDTRTHANGNNGAVSKENNLHITDKNNTKTDAELSIKSIVCYGIGNIAESVIASYQMSLLMALRDNLQVPDDQCFVYDPVLCENEKSALKELGFTLIKQNEECKRLATQLTLFFMPHCGKAMYNNLLWRNWHPKHLPNVVILGNSFNTIRQSSPARFLEKEAWYIQQVATWTEELSIPNTFTHSDIFNNTSLHVFPPDLALATGSKEQPWQPCEEPSYEHDCEIIKDKK